MKSSFAKALIFIAIMMLTFNANAQTDYVITVKGDSIPCTIRTSLTGREKYKSDAMSDFKKVTPEAVREYYIARKNFRERRVYADNNARPLFMGVVEKGRISLYKTIPYNKTSTTKWYIGKGSDYVSDLKTGSLYLSKPKQKRKDILGEMLMDNKSVYDKYIAEDKFSFKQIQSLVHLYNTGQPLKD